MVLVAAFLTAFFGIMGWLVLCVTTLQTDVALLKKGQTQLKKGQSRIEEKFEALSANIAGIKEFPESRNEPTRETGECPSRWSRDPDQQSQRIFARGHHFHGFAYSPFPSPSLPSLHPLPSSGSREDRQRPRPPTRTAPHGTDPQSDRDSIVYHAIL